RRGFPRPHAEAPRRVRRGPGYRMGPAHQREAARRRQDRRLPAKAPPSVKARITLLTLGVDDLERAVRFYRDGLGWKTEGIVGREFEHGAVAFFDLMNGLKLALWRRNSLSHDSGLPVGKPSSTDIYLAHNVRSQAEVDAVMAEAK